MVLCPDSLQCHFIQHRVFLGGISKAPSEGEFGRAGLSGISLCTMKIQVSPEALSGHNWPPWFLSLQSISLSFSFLVGWGKSKHQKLFLAIVDIPLRAGTETLPLKDVTSSTDGNGGGCEQGQAVGYPSSNLTVCVSGTVQLLQFFLLIFLL